MNSPSNPHFVSGKNRPVPGQHTSSELDDAEAPEAPAPPPPAPAVEWSELLGACLTLFMRKGMVQPDAGVGIDGETYQTYWK